MPPLLLVLTVVTGIVDAVAYLRLGHVFVANMTGNVVFLGFAAGGASGFSFARSLGAIAAFLAGGIAAGRLLMRSADGRAHQLRTATAVQALSLVPAIVVAALAGDDIGTASAYALIVLLGIAMGIQNATARRLAVADLTTTVLTLTLTGIAADSRIAGGSGTKAGRRLLAVAAMALGALVGALLVLDVAPVAALALAGGMLAVVCVAADRSSRRATAPPDQIP